MHEWDIPPKTAIELQRELAKLVVIDDQLGSVRTIAGVDMAIDKASGMARGTVVLLSYPELQILEQHVHLEPLRMPYIPGLLSFREAPSIIQAFDKLTQRPNLVMVDGSGIAHPRRLGIACHLGLWWDLPTIGCAKSLLIGHFDESSLSQQAGNSVPLIDKETIIGAVVRTRANTRPLFISPGHRISLKTSIEFVLACCDGYRLPVPTRLADKLSKAQT